MGRIIAIDRGNDSVKAAVVESGRIVLRWRSEGKGHIAAWVAESAPEGACVSSVVGSWNGACMDELAGSGLERVHFVDHSSPLPFRLEVGSPERIGADRLCAAAAVAAAGVEDAVIIDAGTAVTVDLLSGGALVGGAIMPGLDMMLRSLSEGTAALPRIEAASAPKERILPPGRDTESAMLAGAEAAFCGGAAELVRLMQEILGREVPVYLTGGGAGLLENAVRPRPVMSPDLVLYGLNSIYYNKFI